MGFVEINTSFSKRKICMDAGIYRRCRKCVTKSRRNPPRNQTSGTVPLVGTVSLTVLRKGIFSDIINAGM